MQQNKKTIVVTGSNKGIGYALVQYLSKHSQWHVVLAARNLKLGQQSLDKIKAENPQADVIFEQLDVSSFESIDNFISRLSTSNQRIDILVNNAGILQPGWTEQHLNKILQTNYRGTVYLTNKALPLIPQNGKIITVSSTLAQYPNSISNPELKKRWQTEDLSQQELDALVTEFQEAVKSETLQEKGFFKSPFGVYPFSKLALSTHIRVISQSPEILSKNIQVYNLCPGYVSTDINNNTGHLTVEQGIDTIVYLIDLPFELNKDFQGKLFTLRNILSLDAEKAITLP